MELNKAPMAFRAAIETSRFNPDHVVQVLLGEHRDGLSHSGAVLFSST